MLPYVLRRLLWFLPTLFGISLLSFAVVRMTPGDPSLLMFSGDDVQAADDVDAQVRAVRARLLLDEALWKQYLHYLGPFDLSPTGHALFGGSGLQPYGGLLALDLGEEVLRPGVKVSHELVRRARVTLPLAALAVLLTYLIAIPLGVLSAVRRGTTLDRGCTGLLFLLYALPSFWVAVLLQLAFGRTGLDWLPVIGLRSVGAEELSAGGQLLDLARHLVLPLFCYTYGSLAYLSRQMRASVIENLARDYVLTARAKGLSGRDILLRHVLKNSAVPVITLFANVLPVLVGGSVIIEMVFDLPGLGRYAYEGLLHREVDVIMATTLLSALATLAGLLLSDLLYALVDPRVRLGGRA